MKTTLNITINNSAKQVDVDTRSILLDMIREQLGLTGSHLGCGTGTCGACTVMLDDRTVKSCCVMAADVDGQSITTIEGVSQGSELHAIQQAFVEKHGIQCGFCTPGMVLSSLQLLSENATPTEAEIREAIAGNLCRCTGYVNIVAAIQDAAVRLRHE